MQRPKGSKQVHRRRKLQSFPSDSGSCSDGVADEDSASFQLGFGSSKQPFGTPMKKLLAEELSRETEPKRRAPGVIGRLMGLDGLPLQLPANKHHKHVSENNVKGTTPAAKTRSSGKLYGSRTSGRYSKNQQEFKDVFEVSEISNIEGCRYSSQGSAKLKITDDEMSFVEQKFMDAKLRATYQDLPSSQDSHDTLEILDSNNDLLQKYFKRPDSLFKRHLDDLQGSPFESHFDHIKGTKSSDIENYEHGDLSPKPGREIKGLNYNRSHQKHRDGYSSHVIRKQDTHSSPKSSKLQFRGRGEPDAVPTRIVILKPNLGKVQKATKIGSPPCSSHTSLLDYGKYPKFSDSRFRDAEVNQRINLPDNAWHSRQNSLESREIAKEITSQMKNNLSNGSMLLSTSRFRGNTWDNGSCSFSGNESLEESEATPATLGNSFYVSNTISPSSCFSESFVSKEAKKRLSERWKMSLKSQQGHSVSRSGTLAEMLATPDKESKTANFDSSPSGGLRDKLSSNGKPAGWVEPLGISSRDGWKDGCIGSLPRSKSLPASSTTSFGSPRTILYHEALHDDRFMMPKVACKRERKKVVKCLDQRQCMNTRNLKSKKYRCPHPSNLEGNESSPDLNTIQNKVRLNLEEDLPKHEMVAAESLAEIDGETIAVTEAVVNVADENAVVSSESYIKELSVGSSAKNSVPLQTPVSGLESSCCKDADQPSPVSVLEPSFTDDLSSCSECFESLSVDIQGLRMQLQLLKLESEEFVEGSVLIQSDEDGGEAYTGISEDNGLLNGDSWESSYMIDVLSESGIDRALPDAFLEVWHSLECPVSLSVFDELEKKYSDWSTCPRSERRLLFDRINWGIIDIYEQFVSAQPWVIPSRATNLCSSSKLIKSGLQDCLYKMLWTQGKVKDTTLGKVLVSELQWLNLRDDIDGIGSKVESLLLDDLVAEIAVT
ncbi:uncharacterized protein HKW66_Vig0052520 [Vigna angularis]|uniref:DUF4378 domain-containing protein n=2 Tax=Phaseolus angularis TaxID=3914 RepID=A0A8T0L1D5_PHAAN|nr:uncharacterized protein LOC108329569 isoform X1 [Vigna angularis]KAG2405997.1 uncharacterized protein HKW66_Vig0052520 [Vigna angularis]BAT85644.1 hypothetical protein VIGAN_04321400 [Vigna angularis var. angularis]